MRSAALLLAATLAVPAAAEPIRFTYSWDVLFGHSMYGSPDVVEFRAAAAGRSEVARSGASAVIAATTFTRVVELPPDTVVLAVLLNDPVGLRLTLTDAASGQSGELTFGGVVVSAVGLPEADEPLHARFDCGRAAVIGDFTYEVTLWPYANIPYDGTPLEITASVTVRPVPELGSLALAVFGAAGCVLWRRMARARGRA